MEAGWHNLIDGYVERGRDVFSQRQDELLHEGA
jgi:hypothetical protein